jgi:hypothetical protein
MKRRVEVVVFLATLFSLFALAKVDSVFAQQSLTLKAIGNGERVRLSYKGRTKIVKLEEDFSGDFVAGGDPPHRYTTLLMTQKDNSLYIVARFQSGAAISDPNAACGGDRPSTLLFIKTNTWLQVEKVQTEVYDSCIYYGSGRYPKGKPKVINNSVTVLFDEGRKKFRVLFDGNDPDKGLQITQQ